MDPTSFAPSCSERTPTGNAAHVVECTVYFDWAQAFRRHHVSDSIVAGGPDHGLAEYVTLKGAEGFGRRRRVAWEGSDLGGPVVSIVTVRDGSSAAWLRELGPMARDHLVTLADAVPVEAPAQLVESFHEDFVELTFHCRRGKGLIGVAGIIDLLRRHGVARATAFGNGEGYADGQRYRDRVLMRSPAAPALVTSIDRASMFADVLPHVLALPAVRLVTAKPVWVWKDQGALYSTPIAVDRDGPRCLTVVTADDSGFLRRPTYTRMNAELRAAHAAGATVLRARLGYERSEPVRPRRQWGARRGTPMVTKIVDSRDRIAQWFEVVDGLTSDRDFVACEAVRIPSPPSGAGALGTMGIER